MEYSADFLGAVRNILAQTFLIVKPSYPHIPKFGLYRQTTYLSTIFETNNMTIFAQKGENPDRIV